MCRWVRCRKSSYARAPTWASEPRHRPDATGNLTKPHPDEQTVLFILSVTGSNMPAFGGVNSPFCL